MFRSIRWRIAIPYVALILITMLGLTIFVSDQVRQARLANLQDQLLADARLLANSVEPLLAGGTVNGEVDATAKLWADLLDARVTIIAADGTVLGESYLDRARMENHLGRPEVQQALREGEGGSTRFSRTVGYDMMYAASLVADSEEEQPLGFVRVSLPLEEIEANVGLLRNTIVTAGLLTAFLAAVLALLIAERIAAPVRRLTAVADRMAEGDLEARLLPTSRDEVGQLTRAFNRMADQLRAQVTSLAEERGRLAAMLDHMADGVLITDDEGRVQLINPSAARLFDTSEEEALGRSFAQVVPHHQLIDLWKLCRDEGQEQIETIEISHHDLFLQAFVTPFQGGGAQGYLVILQDLTRIRRLETVRRDFISNISHELRTPLAGLKALVDTLRGGAIKDPPAAKRFLKRMDSEVDTLTQMVQELLDLSLVESGQAPLHLERVAVPDLLLQPVERLRPQARRAGLDLSVVLPPDLPPVTADAERIQMVVTNLIHNALKFTEPGGKVVVSASVTGQQVVVSVKDTGVGIPADDLPRIFERFYKADQARSGGGTGLGLAIAKHTLQSHGERIWVESVEGQGSTFLFSLAIAP